MIVNTKWLKEFLSEDVDDELLARSLTNIGLEVESSIEVRDAIDPVRIGFVRELTPIAESNMYALKVDLGDRTVPIVCGSEHVIEVGMGVPVALSGMKLPNGDFVSEIAIRGHDSVGMLCLDSELGLLSDDEGLFVTRDESLIGKRFVDVRPVDEYLVDITILANRPDCMGLVGVSREVAAHFDIKYILPEVATFEPENLETLDVGIESPGLSKRYCALRIEGVNVEPSPMWLKSRVRLIGQQSINNVVDVTNYVLYEWGQPIHSFDWDQIDGGRVVVRLGREDEELELLNNKVVQPQDRIVIADNSRPIALAGIMGGFASETRPNTKSLLIECAHFDAPSIMTTVRNTDLGLNQIGTDASRRFERGTDPNNMLEGAQGRTLKLIQQVAGGNPTGHADCYPALVEPIVHSIPAERVNSLLGTELDQATISELLSRLDIECKGIHDYQVPTWRQDAGRDVALIEDVARLIGYDLIATDNAHIQFAGFETHPIDLLRSRSRHFLTDQGFFECKTPAFGSDEDHSLAIQNSESQGQSSLRVSLLSTLFAALEYNLRRNRDSVRLFEVDKIFFDPQAPKEEWRVSALAAGQYLGGQWKFKDEQYDFFHIKGMFETLVEALVGRSVRLAPRNEYPFLNGASAVAIDEETSIEIGVLGQVDVERLGGRIRKRLPVFGFELNLEKIVEIGPKKKSAVRISSAPPLIRDISFTVSESTNYSDIKATIVRAAGASLEEIHLIERFVGEQISKGSHALVFRLQFRDKDGSVTMTSAEADELVNGVFTALSEIGATIR